MEPERKIEKKGRVDYRRLVYRSLYVFIKLIIVGFVVFLFVTNPGINGYKKAMFPDMIYGQAFKPYAYRALVPYTIRNISNLIPASTKETFHGFVKHNFYDKSVFMQKYWHEKYLVEYAVAVMVLYLILLGFSFALRYLLTGIYNVSSRYIDLMILVSLLLLPGAFKYYSYLYDFATLLLFTLCLGLMIRKHWIRYLLVFILACLNKETAILLIMVFLIHFFKRKIGAKLYARLIYAQTFIYVLIRIVLGYIFKDNRGSILEFHLFQNLGKRLIVPLALGLIIYFGVSFRWKEKPKLLKDGLWILVPLLIMGFIFGFFDELRGYYESYPVIFCLLFHTFAVLLNKQISQTGEICPRVKVK